MPRPKRNVTPSSEGKSATLMELVVYFASPREGEPLRCEVMLGHSEFGTPRPLVRVTQLPDALFRRLSAALHLLAAAVEAYTPTNERWCTCIDSRADSSGDVYLDLYDGGDAEAARGVAHLRDAVRRLGWT